MNASRRLISQAVLSLALILNLAWAAAPTTPDATPWPRKPLLGGIFKKKTPARQTPGAAEVQTPPSPHELAPPLRYSPVQPPAESHQTLYNPGTERKSTAAPSPRTHAPRNRSTASARYASVRQTNTHETTGPTPISLWPTGRKLVALTYDDGPNPTVTPKLITLLKSKSVPATFFLLGQSVKAHPEIARQIAEEGFEIGNHSYSHPQLTKLADEQIRRELQTCADLIASATGGAPIRIMRPTYGAHNQRVRQIANDMGYKIILWDVDTNDWRKRTTEQMVATILAEVRDGSIILMHDRYQTTLDTTAQIIDELRARGFTFATVSEMLATPREAPAVTESQPASATANRPRKASTE